MPSNKKTDWIYRESTKKLLMRLLLAGCVISVLLELFVLGRKEKFGVDGWFGFYALLGFVSCTLMIFAAKGLGLWLKVPTDFYEEEKTGESSKNPSKRKNAKKAARKISKKKEGEAK